MKLYSPVKYQNDNITECEIKKPTPGVIADTHKFVNENRYGMSIFTFVSGSIESYKTKSGQIIDNKENIKNITRLMHQKTCEDLSIDIMLKLCPDDAVEGMYNCPRCPGRVISELRDKIDTRDYISNLEVVPYHGEDVIIHDLLEPYTIKKGQEVVQEVKSIKVRQQTVQDYIEASAMYGKDYARVQYKILAKCITEVNNQPVEKEWLNKYSMLMIENIDTIHDINVLSKKMTNFGRIKTVEKNCIECGKKWEAEINTANFFGSGLQQV